MGRQDRMELAYKDMADGGNHRLLQRIDSVGHIDNSVPSRRHSSRINLCCKLEPSDSRILATRSFEEDFGIGHFPRPRYHPNDSNILVARSFDGDVVRSCDDLTLNPSFQSRLGLPPRPPGRYVSHNRNHHLTTSRRHSTWESTCFAERGQRETPIRLAPDVRDHRTPPLYPRQPKADRSGRFPRIGDRPFRSKSQPRKIPSLPVIPLETRGRSPSRPRLTRKSSTKTFRKASGVYREESKSGRKEFSPQRSSSIHRRFEKQDVSSEVDGDVWVERIIVHGTSGRKTTYFKSVHGKLVRKEPPTGAKSIVYLEDIIDERQGKASDMQKSLKQKKPQPQTQSHPPLQQSQQNQKQKQQATTSPGPKNSSKDSTDDDTAESKNGKGGRKQRSPPKRGSSFFGFMKKESRKAKTKAEI